MDMIPTYNCRISWGGVCYRSEGPPLMGTSGSRRILRAAIHQYLSRRINAITNRRIAHELSNYPRNRPTNQSAHQSMCIPTRASISESGNKSPHRRIDERIDRGISGYPNSAESQPETGSDLRTGYAPLTGGYRLGGAP